MAPLAALLLAALGLAAALAIAPFQLDDSYITYRYAAQLGSGEGLAFNSGEQPVEGFSNPSWLLLLTTIGAVAGKESLPAGGLLLGLLAYAGLLATAWRSGRGDPDLARLIPIALLACTPAFCFYAATGLETLWFVLLVLVTACATSGRLPLSWGVVAAFLAVWTRPEGPWLGFMLAAQAVASKGPWRAWFGRPYRQLAAALIAGFTTLLASRWLIFGELLPNTYHAKIPDRGAGWDYFVDSFTQPWMLGFWSLAVLGSGGQRHHRSLLAAALAWAAAPVLEGGDWMPNQRLLLPAAALAALAAAGIGGAKGREYPWRRFAAIAVVLSATLLGLLGSLREAAVTRRSWSISQQEKGPVIDWLEASGASSIALVDIGEIGFRTGVEIVDLGGLTDRHIGRSPGNHLAKRFDLDYIFDQRQPDALLLRLTRLEDRVLDGPPQMHPADAASDTEARLLADPRLTQRYRLRALLSPAYDVEPFEATALWVAEHFSSAPAAAEALPVNAPDDLTIRRLESP